MWSHDNTIEMYVSIKVDWNSDSMKKSLSSQFVILCMSFCSVCFFCVSISGFGLIIILLSQSGQLSSGCVPLITIFIFVCVCVCECVCASLAQNLS